MVNWIWNRLLTKECVIPLMAIIALLILVLWFVDDRNQQLEQENQRLVDRQVQIDRAILEGILSIQDALPRPVNYVEVMSE